MVLMSKLGNLKITYHIRLGRFFWKSQRALFQIISLAEEGISFSDKTQPICLPHQSNEDPDKWLNRKVEVLGYATKDFSGSKGDVMRAAEMSSPWLCCCPSRTGSSPWQPPAHYVQARPLRDKMKGKRSILIFFICQASLSLSLASVQFYTFSKLRWVTE